MDSPVLGILITLLLVLTNAFFVAAEFALVKVRASQIELLVQTGNKMARMAQHLIAHLDAYLSATRLGVTLASLGLGWIGEPVVTRLILGATALVGLHVNPELAHNLALPVAFLLLTFLRIVFGELVPKSLAIQRPRPTALAVAFPLWLFSVLLFPVIAALNWMANRVLWLLGIEATPESSHYHSSQELRLLLEQGREDRTIKEAEHKLIENVFEFSETVVKEIMVARTHIVAIDIHASSSQLLKTMVEEGYTRMPLYDGGLDNICGIVHAKDLFPLLEHTDLIILQDILRPAFFVPETKPISQLLREFQHRKTQLAIVVDEFGSTAGLVTMEDILEELVGEIQDEYDNETAGVEKLADGKYVIRGSLTISDVNDRLDDFQLPEGNDYTTLNGLINKWFGRIPEVSEVCEQDGLRITVLKTENHHITQVRIEQSKSHRGVEHLSPRLTQPNGHPPAARSTSDRASHQLREVSRLTLYTRPNCSLCHTMKATLLEVQVDTPFQLETIDISTDPKLNARFGLEIPLLYINGRRAFMYELSAAELRRCLDQEQTSAP